MIYWTAFSSEAFATLATGVMAVGAALWVGWRQTGIQRRLVLLDENNLKVQLFDRREKCIAEMREIHAAWLSSATLNREDSDASIN